MNPSDIWLTDIQGLFDATGYSDLFLQQYDPIECLAHKHGTETFIVRAKKDGVHYIAKCYDLLVFPNIHEDEILSQLCHEGFPDFIDSYKNSQMHVSIREFVVGEPLDRYVMDNRFSQRRALQICNQLCTLLRYLHEREQPIIHRDIKPQNVIIRPDGHVVLIDFDIARQYHDGTEPDTQTLGTRFYAPPEQYGFSQTDCRTDIYAMGVLLRFLMAHCDEQLPGANVKAICKIIERCTAFAPQNRFQNVASLQRSLRLAGGYQRRMALRLLSSALFAAVLLSTGFSAGRFTSILSPVHTQVVFQEPLIEAAARVQLGMEADEPLTAEMLATVRKLFVFGTEVAAERHAFDAGLIDADRYTRGGIISLEDLALMPNLEEIEIAYQGLEDISGIAVLKYLRSLNLRHTGVSDVTPLAGIQTLQFLGLFDSNVSDLTTLSSNTRLHDLEVGATLVTTVDNLCGYETITRLSLKGLSMKTLRGIERFTSLQTLYLSNAEIGVLDAIESVLSLRTVHATDELYDRLTVLLAGTNVTLVRE